MKKAGEGGFRGDRGGKGERMKGRGGFGGMGRKIKGRRRKELKEYWGRGATAWFKRAA